MNAYLVAVLLFAGTAWPTARWLHDSKAVPHWWVGAVAGLGVLLLEAQALAAVLSSDLGWAVRLSAVGGFVLVAPATLAWTIVAALWLRHRSVTEYVGRHETSGDVGGLMNAPTQRLKTLPH